MSLLELLKRNEGKTLEFKRDLSSPDGVLKAIVAFANTAGGTVVIGVEDESKRVRGVPDVLQAEERLANIIAEGVRPRLVPDIEVVPWRKVNVLTVHVYPSYTRPHYVERLGPVAGVFIRVGSTSRRAEESQIEELERVRRMDSFDEQGLPDLNSEAIDFRAASEFFAPYRRLLPRDLATLRITREHQGKQVPTVGGLLLFGKDRFSRFPDTWIQAGRFAGTNRARILDSAEIRSPLARAAEEAVTFAQKHLMRETVIAGVRREERWSAPLVAIREAVMNAVVHADYSQHGSPIRVAIYDDRIEIENPGLLPFGLTVEDIRQGVSKLRNRVIGRVFYELRLIEQWGSGIQRMTAACLEAGLAAPVLEELATNFRVTISTARIKAPAADRTDRRILEYLRTHGPLSTAVIARRARISPRATLTRLQALKSRGLIVEIGTGPHDPKRQYALAL